ncbi:MAG: substrate-binding domain-containing protein [Clostridiales bacterium]|nr:substrate-binding domain-containing protein [Clostridiales bacterium]
MKKIVAVMMCALLSAGMLAGCSGDTGSSTAEDGSQAASGAAISVVSREEGSGTRGAFTELFGIEDADGNDATTELAEINSSTSVVMQTVAGNPDAIGYISLGSLNGTVKALEIDGAAATVENINSGAYKIYRPFNIVTTGELSPAAADFVSFILSEQGQAVVGEDYISVENTGAYTPSGVTGTITVSGSSSVTPVMQQLKEEYEALNSGVTIELQQSDSTTGVNDALAGTADIGMASRELKESETAAGAVGTVIANDGIAVIVSNDNSVTGLTSEQVKGIFMGEITSWGEIA